MIAPPEVLVIGVPLELTISTLAVKVPAPPIPPSVHVMFWLTVWLEQFCVPDVVMFVK